LFQENFYLLTDLFLLDLFLLDLFLFDLFLLDLFLLDLFLLDLLKTPVQLWMRFRLSNASFIFLNCSGSPPLSGCSLMDESFLALLIVFSASAFGSATSARSSKGRAWTNALK
jgi:hypothetical protein